MAAFDADVMIEDVNTTKTIACQESNRGYEQSTSSANLPKPKLIFKININTRKRGRATRNDSVTEIATDSLATAPPTTTKQGRSAVARKKKHSGDELFGYEYDALMAAPIRPTGGRSKAKEKDRLSAVSTGGSTSMARRATPKLTIHMPSGANRKAQESLNSEPSSGGCASDYSEITNTLTSAGEYLMPVSIDSDIHAIFNLLDTQQDTQTCLPSLRDRDNEADSQPWTARHLAQLYILCCERGRIDWCDLVADTWIHAFHEANRESKMKGPSWLTFTRVFTDKERPKHQDFIDFHLPELAADVTKCDASVINTLFTNVSHERGIKTLWADAAALYGSSFEHQISRTRGEWHPDFVHQVLCTALRMVRRRLTLNIEQEIEGAWCRRYHLHGTQGRRCYREVAKEEVDKKTAMERKKDWSVVDEVEEMKTEGEKRVRFTETEDDPMAVSKAE